MFSPGTLIELKAISTVSSLC